MKITGRLGRWSRTSPQHIDRASLERLIPASFFDVSFTIVRHPVARIVSAFHFQLEVERAIPADTRFSYWLEELRDLLDEEGFVYDNHLRPQAAFVPEGATVFRLEDGLDAVLSWLAEETGGTPPSRQAARDNVTGLAPPPDAGALARIRPKMACDARLRARDSNQRPVQRNARIIAASTNGIGCSQPNCPATAAPYATLARPLPSSVRSTAKRRFETALSRAARVRYASPIARATRPCRTTGTKTNPPRRPALRPDSPPDPDYRRRCAASAY